MDNFAGNEQGHHDGHVAQLSMSSAAEDNKASAPPNNFAPDEFHDAQQDYFARDDSKVHHDHQSHSGGMSMIPAGGSYEPPPVDQERFPTLAESQQFAAPAQHQHHQAAPIGQQQYAAPAHHQHHQAAFVQHEHLEALPAQHHHQEAPPTVHQHQEAVSVQHQHHEAAPVWSSPGQHQHHEPAHGQHHEPAHGQHHEAALGQHQHHEPAPGQHAQHLEAAPGQHQLHEAALGQHLHHEVVLGEQGHQELAPVEHLHQEAAPVQHRLHETAPVQYQHQEAELGQHQQYETARSDHQHHELAPVQQHYQQEAAPAQQPQDSAPVEHHHHPEAAPTSENAAFSQLVQEVTVHHDSQQFDTSFVGHPLPPADSGDGMSVQEAALRAGFAAGGKPRPETHYQKPQTEMQIHAPGHNMHPSDHPPFQEHQPPTLLPVHHQQFRPQDHQQLGHAPQQLGLTHLGYQQGFPAPQDRQPPGLGQQNQQLPNLSAYEYHTHVPDQPPTAAMQQYAEAPPQGAPGGHYTLPPYQHPVPAAQTVPHIALPKKKPPKRPKGSYLFYSLEARPVLMKSQPNLSFVEITRQMASDWKHVITPEEKKKYEALAAEDHVRFQYQMKQYKEEELANKGMSMESSPPQKKRKIKKSAIDMEAAKKTPGHGRGVKREEVTEKEMERRQAATERMRKRRSSMNEEEKRDERKRNALRVRLRRASLSPDLKSREKARNAERQRLARLAKQTSMTDDDLSTHKARLAARKRELRHMKMKDMTEGDKQKFAAHQAELQRQRRVKRESNAASVDAVNDPPNLDPAAVATAAAAAAATNPELEGIQVSETGEILSGQQVAGTIHSLHQHILKLEEQVKELQQQNGGTNDSAHVTDAVKEESQTTAIL
jgi:hypothetical protein